MIEEILLEIAKQGPIISLLIAAIIYFLKREKGKEADIKELNEYIRESDKDNLIMLEKVAHTLDKIVDKENDNTDKLMTELRSMRDAIITRLENK